MSDHRAFAFTSDLLWYFNEKNEVIYIFQVQSERKLVGFQYVTPHNQSSVFGASKMYDVY